MKNKRLTTIFILSLLVFLSVTFIFTEARGFLWDQQMASWVDKFSNPVLNKGMTAVSLLGSSEVVLLLTFVITLLFFFKKDWYHIFFFLTVSVGGVFLNFILKMLFQRERPGGEVSYIEVFNFSLEIPSYSFPSGHTMRSTILLVFLLYIVVHFIRKTSAKIWLSVVAIILMLGVALSRLFLEAHFFSDTLAAVSVSIAWFCLVYMIFKENKKEETNVLYDRWRS